MVLILGWFILEKYVGKVSKKPCNSYNTGILFFVSNKAAKQ